MVIGERRHKKQFIVRHGKDGFMKHTMMARRSTTRTRAHAKFSFIQANFCPKIKSESTANSELLPKNHVDKSKSKLREKIHKHMKPLHVLHGRVVALSEDQTIGAMAGGSDIQSQFDKAIEMAPDGGMLFRCRR